MVYKIVWTPDALDSYLEIMNSLQIAWTEKEINSFANNLDERIRLLTTFSRIGSPFNKKRKLRKTLVHSTIQLYYKIDITLGQIILLLFWDTRQNPNKLKKLSKK